MKRIAFVPVAVMALAGAVAYMAPASGEADGEAAPIFGVKMPPGYRDWRLISVAHEEGNLNDIREARDARGEDTAWLSRIMDRLIERAGLPKVTKT